MKKILFMVVVLLAALVALYFYFNAGVSHKDICDCVTAEGKATRARVDLRADRIEAKLDRVEAKLDKLLKLADRPLVDGMKRVE